MRGSDLKHPDTESSLAHEVTHRRLIYEKGYCFPYPLQALTEIDISSVGLIGTMIDDIIVDKIIKDEGFAPFTSKYFPRVKEETKGILQKTDFYSFLSENETIKARFITYRCVFAWGVQTYFKHKRDRLETLLGYRRAVKKMHPKEYEMANEAINLMKGNNIFTPTGHFNVIKGILPLWKLDAKIGLRTYPN
jgi:hypothetical protein